MKKAEMYSFKLLCIDSDIKWRSSPIIVMVTESRRMSGTAHVACMDKDKGKVVPVL
jgi:hypothetical protein